MTRIVGRAPCIEKIQGHPDVLVLADDDETLNEAVAHFQELGIDPHDIAWATKHQALSGHQFTDIFVIGRLSQEHEGIIKARLVPGNADRLFYIVL